MIQPLYSQLTYSLICSRVTDNVVPTILAYRIFVCYFNIHLIPVYEN